jgi:hypothetical protein
MVRAGEAAGYGIHREDFNLISEPESAAGNLDSNYNYPASVVI